jgi:DNA-binding NarL/FixJ family response regulator
MATDRNKLPPTPPDEVLYDDLPPLVVTSFDNLNFMVIDGDAPSLEFTERVLKAAAVSGVSTAGNAFTAVGLFAQQKAKIDCIICDQQLEGMSGLALLKRIRGGRNSIIPRDTRFIIATDQANEALVQAAVRLDVSGFLRKPIGVNAVLKAIHMAFGRVQSLKSVDAYAKVALPA